jgi:hypothetical protein
VNDKPPQPTSAAKPTTAPATQPVGKADPKQTYVATQLKHSSPFVSCRFDPTGRYLFAGAEDRSVQRWELSSSKQIGFSAHDSWVRSLAFSRDGRTLVTGGYDGRLIWWPASADAPKPIRTIDAHAGWVRQVAVSPDGRLLASAGNDRLLKIWNVADGSLVHSLAGHESHVYSTLFHPSGRFVLSGQLHGQVQQFDLAGGKLLRTFDAKALFSYNAGQGVDFGGVRDMSFSPDGKSLACCGLHKAENPLGAVHEPIVLLFDFDSQKLLQSLTCAVKGVAWRVIHHPQQFLVAASGGSGGGFLIFWKPDQPTEFHKFQLPNTARDMDVHPDGIQVATAHHDSHIRISRMATKA